MSFATQFQRTVSGICGGQKRVPDSLELVHGYCEPLHEYQEPGSSERAAGVFTVEPASLAPIKMYF